MSDNKPTNKDILRKAAEEAGDSKVEIAGKTILEVIGSKADQDLIDRATKAGDRVCSVTGTQLINEMGEGTDANVQRPKRQRVERGNVSGPTQGSPTPDGVQPTDPA